MGQLPMHRKDWEVTVCALLANSSEAAGWMGNTRGEIMRVDEGAD